METVSSHAFELLHNGQELLAAFLDVALLLFQSLLLVKHLLLEHQTNDNQIKITMMSLCMM